MLNDGLGTNALDGSSGATFTIVPPPAGAPEVSSATHPDPNNWYAVKTAELSWNRPAGAYGFSFSLDQSPDTVPDNTLDTTITTTKTYPDLQDGTWYFHIKARGLNTGFGDTTHFRIQIDTQPPDLFEIKLVGQNNLNDVNPTPTISFEAKDLGSGIDYYDVFLDGNLVLNKATSPYTFSKLDTGPHVIRMVAYDKAGNSKKAELPIIVVGPEVVTSQVTSLFKNNIQLPIYILLLTNFATLVLLVISTWRRKKMEKEPADPVAAIQAHIDASLEDLKLHINNELNKFARQSNSGMHKQEEHIADEISGSISKTKHTIDKEISELKKTRKRKPDSLI